MESIKRKELARMLANKSGVSIVQAENTLRDLIDIITDCLSRGESIEINGFGKFEVRTRAARTGRNPATGGEIEIPESHHVHFSARKNLKEAINPQKR